MFELLIQTSGIGAKSAITILANIQPHQFALAIITNDDAKLTKIPGIGKKTAARMILELKDKMKVELDEQALEGDKEESIDFGENIEEAISALQVLGYNRKEIEKAIEKGWTIVCAAVNHILVGVFSISDIIREEAALTISLLQKEGNNISIITGDSQKAANIILGNSGINANIYANVSHFDKGSILQNAKDTKKTVMIGDGINDAIALTAASVGISMRNSTDISIESASAVLLRNDLSIIEKSHKICRKTLRIIKENLFWAFSYNFIAIPLACTGLIHPVMSAAFMSFSSLFVVANSVRIKK